MRIDIHAHLWPQDTGLCPVGRYLQNKVTMSNKKEDTYSFDTDGLLHSMKDAAIDKTIVSALAFAPDMEQEEIDLLNRYVSEAVKTSGGRLGKFCTISPFRDGADKYLRRLIEDEGFEGLKLHCNMQEFYPNDVRLDKIYALMQDYRKPILFHSGGIGIKPYKDMFGRPMYLDETAIKFPELQMILGHAGRIWYEETAMLLRKHEHIYADISTNFGKCPGKQAYPMQRLLEIVKGWAGDTEHLLLGSDFPFYGQQKTVDILRSMKETVRETDMITKDDIEGIIETNAERFIMQRRK